jgi:signal transduction histidine kinase
MIPEPKQSLREELIQWVAATDIMVDNILPSFYDPEFLNLERSFRAQKGHYVELGSLVRPVSMQVQETGDFAWVAIPQKDKIEIRDLLSSSIDAGLLLPREAILVARGRESGAVALWQEDIWGEKGAASSGVAILESLTAESIAWLAKELREPYCQKQIRRLLRGLSFGAISMSDLLRVRVRQLPVEDRRNASEAALQELRTLRKEERLDLLKGTSAHASFSVLSGATFEERRQQFEEYLRRQTNAAPIAFVEAATTNSNSDLFATRLMIRPSVEQAIQIAFAGTPDLKAEQHWRRWYWDGTQNAYRIYHSLTDDTGPYLPEYLFGRLAPGLIATANGVSPGISLMERWARVPAGQMILPKLDQISALLQVVMRSDSDLHREMQVGLQRFVDLAGLDEQHQSDVLHDAYILLRGLFRPILALRIIRGGRTAGAYFLVWNDRSEDPARIKARLKELSEHFLSVLEPPGDFIEVATRRESMRRLSWFAHQINGPIGRADAALRDIQECLENNPDAAALLVPDDATAHRMAAMAKQPIEHYQIHLRLNAAIDAIQDLRKVNYQLRQLRRVQGDLEFVRCKLGPIIQEQILRARQSLPNLRISEIQVLDAEIEGDARLLGEAFQEVFNNSIRELKTRKTQSPTIDVTISLMQDQVKVSIRDNGLPALVNLIDQPFEEESSTYSQQGQGSGLGLTVVREIILRHSGTCSLTPNCDTDGERVEGVTFACNLRLPQYHPDPSNDER